jgi:hypothetical protein
LNESFFGRPILNLPNTFPRRHWELDAEGQPTTRIIETRRRSDLITPVSKPKKRANDPYKALKTTLKAEIEEEAWSSLYSDTSRRQ